MKGQLGSCLCFSTRTGSLVIASCYILITMILVVHNIYALSSGTYSNKLQTWKEDVVNERQKGDITDSEYKIAISFIEALESWGASFLEAGIALGLFELFTSVLVVVGVAQQKHAYLVPWLFYQVVAIASLGVAFCSLSVYISIYYKPTIACVLWAITILCILEPTYWTWVVFSEFLNLRYHHYPTAPSGKDLRLV